MEGTGDDGDASDRIAAGGDASMRFLAFWWLFGVGYFAIWHWRNSRPRSAGDWLALVALSVAWPLFMAWVAWGLLTKDDGEQS